MTKTKKPKRIVSRNGCLSCKKLKIKCNEAKPVCEYCIHTRRRCIYPDEFQPAEGALLSDEIIESYSSPSSASSSELSPFEEDIYSDSRQFTFQVLLHSTASQLQLSQFELRMLRLFNDVCLPYITYNVNKRHVEVWNKVVPQYFVYCQPIRSAMLATGCLTLMCMMGVQNVLEDGMTEDALTSRLENTCEKFEVQRLFADDHLFDDDTGDRNLFRRASELVSKSIVGARNAIELVDTAELNSQQKLTYMIGAHIGNSLLFGFLALQPWKLVPLVHFPKHDGDHKADLLGMAFSMKAIALEHLPALKASDIGELYQQDEFWLAPRRKIPLVDHLRTQMNEYFGETSFFDIDSETNAKIKVYSESLSLLQRLCLSAVAYNYPVGIFRWLLLQTSEFLMYVRAQEPFALRMLYVYSCICIYYRFWLFDQNIWRDYVLYFRENHGPLCEFDERLFHYVVTRRKCLMDENYRGIKDFDVWSREFDYEDRSSEGESSDEPFLRSMELSHSRT